MRAPGVVGDCGLDLSQDRRGLDLSYAGQGGCRRREVSVEDRQVAGKTLTTMCAGRWSPQRTPPRRVQVGDVDAQSEQGAHREFHQGKVDVDVQYAAGTEGVHPTAHAARRGCGGGRQLLDPCPSLATILNDCRQAMRDRNRFVHDMWGLGLSSQPELIRSQRNNYSLSSATVTLDALVATSRMLIARAVDLGTGRTKPWGRKPAD